MTRVLAIAGLTFREGIRMRIVLVFLIVLGFVVLRLPTALRGDETLTGRVQTFLSYSLGALSLLAGLATIFLSCASLTTELRTRSLHLLVTKPVSRFGILAGKWLGVNLLNLLIVALCGVAIYALALYIRRQPEKFERDRLNLRDAVWTARLAATPTPPDFEQAAREYVAGQIKQGHTFMDEEAAVREYVKQRREGWLSLRPGEARSYRFEGLRPPARADTVYQVRFKARGTYPLPPDELLPIRWMIVDPQTGAVLDSIDTSERAAERHQFLLRAKNVVKDGVALLGVGNLPTPTNRSTVYFEGENSLELLYIAGTFEGNYVKALLLIVFRLAFLSAAGVFFSTFVSFPVACFCVLSLYAFGLGLPFWLESIGAELTVVNPKVDPYGSWGPAVRSVLVPLLILVLPNFSAYDGISRLIDGGYITYGLLAIAGLHTLVYGMALVGLPGWLIFRAREVAEVIV